MNRRRSALATAAVLGVSAMALAGCAQANPTAKPENTKPAVLPLVGWTQASSSQLKQGGTLNLAAAESGTDAGNWNLNTTQGAEVDVQNITAPLMGGPLIATKDGTVKVNPDYATSVKLISESPQTIQVKLNPKAVWQDGTPITAKDYQATFAALSGKNAAFNIASSAGYSNVSSFTVESPTEFEYTYDTPYADWQATAATVALPANVASDPNLWNKGFTTKPLPSSGPFIMSKIDNNAKVYTETPNPKWWGAKPHLDKIIWTVIDQGAQAQAFANSELNAVQINDVDTYTAALKKSGAKAQDSGGLSYSQVYFNGVTAPLNDYTVRKALSQAINRELIAKTANTPLGVPATTMGNWIYMPGQKGYQDVVSQKLPYDPSASKALLKEAGWSNSNGQWTKDGKQLKLSIIVPQGTKSNELRAQQIQASLKAIDVPVTLNEVPSADYFTDIIAGKYEMATFGWNGTLFPVSSGESLFYPAQKPGGNGQNYAFVTDPKLGPLWTKANTELDPAKRIGITNDINNVIAGYLPFLPIAPYPNVYVVDKGLANFGASTFMGQAEDWTQVGYLK